MAHYLLDCDPGHDDAVALLVAARFLPLIGVTTVFGNSTVQNTTRNALAILDAAGRADIPVAMGADRPMTGAIRSGETVHGKSGLDGAKLPGSQRKAETESAVEFIATQAEKYDDLVIIAVAPQTNLGSALKQYPGLADRIKGVSVMGGSTLGGNATAAAEFNIYADPEAASLVFESGIPITMVGLNVTTTFGITSQEVDRLKSSNSLVAKELGGALGFYLARQSSIYERDFAPVHDICAVLPFSHPRLISYEPMHVAIECDGKYTRGMTVCDQRGVVEGEGIDLTLPPNASVAVECDGDSIVNVLVETLLSYD